MSSTTPPGTYWVPDSVASEQLEVKRSKFITYIARAGQRHQAEQFIEEIRHLHPQARHVCWAFIAGAPETGNQACSDDGEPAGTAGRPMLNVLANRSVGEIVAVVVRYFGGIKLGTGGLHRAYAESVNRALERATLTCHLPMRSLRLCCAYREEDAVRRTVRRFAGVITSVSYQQQAEFVLDVPVDRALQFVAELRELSAGRIQVEPGQ